MRYVAMWEYIVHSIHTGDGLSGPNFLKILVLEADLMHEKATIPHGGQ